MAKTLLDRCVVAVLLFLMAPGFVLIILAIRLTSAGPVFCRERRIGQGGRAFTLLTFRTTVCDPPDAEGLADESGEPRLTRVGLFLHRHALADLPQLVNVLIGDMSLVGPRPCLASTPEEPGPRLLVKPGLTGLWQMRSGRIAPDRDNEREVERYVENWSVGLDLRILWRSFRSAVHGARAA